MPLATPFATGAVGAGMALHASRTGWPFRTFVVLGDGECAEGSVWETAMFASHSRLSGLVAVVDVNGLQGLGTTAEVLGLEPFAGKWRSFGWETIEVDGHDGAALRSALDVVPEPGAAPRCVLARTVKGRGVSFMEHEPVVAGCRLLGSTGTATSRRFRTRTSSCCPFSSCCGACC